MRFDENDSIGKKERAILVGIFSSSRHRDKLEESLIELNELAKTAGAEMVEKVLQERGQPDPSYFVGKGKAEEIGRMVTALEADVLILDDNLTPRQKVSLEEVTGCKTIDRTQLILDIFAKRASTKEGKLQVELAQLLYMLPRLTGKGVELSRLGGGIGTRGPGETKLELDRRRIKRRIQLLQEELEKVKRHRSVQRLKRKETAIPIVALVGYTNAGKSTLFNTLTHADAFVSNQLFATLDPLLRRIRLPNGQEVLISDTVGFIKKLPHDLVAAFRATLEEVTEADLLLHVVDVSERNYSERMAAVEAVLQELEVRNIPRINVFNKIDRLNPTDLETRHKPINEVDSPNVLISALNGDGLDQLLSKIVSHLEKRLYHLTFKIPYDKANLASLIHEKGRVLKERFTSTGIRIEAEVPKSILAQHPELVVVRPLAAKKS